MGTLQKYGRVSTATHQPPTSPNEAALAPRAAPDDPRPRKLEFVLMMQRGSNWQHVCSSIRQGPGVSAVGQRGGPGRRAVHPRVHCAGVIVGEVGHGMICVIDVQIADKTS